MSTRRAASAARGDDGGPHDAQPAEAALAQMSRTSLIAQVALVKSEDVTSAANMPITLDDPSQVCLVVSGAVDVFLFEVDDGEAVSGARHLARVEAGQLVFGLAASDMSLTAVGKGLPGTRLARLLRSDLADPALADELAAQADAWIASVSHAIAQPIEPHPRPDAVVDPAASESLPASAVATIVSARPGTVAWAASDAVDVAYLGTETLSQSTAAVPLTSDTWLTAPPHGTLRISTSAGLAADGRLLEALDDFHRLALSAEQLNRMLARADAVNEQTAREALRRRDAESAAVGLSRIHERHPTQDAHGASMLMSALALIGKRQGIDFRAPLRHGDSGDAEPSLTDVVRASGVRAREVRLSSEDRWWLGDSGAMLGRRAADGQPVALLPHWTGRYRVVDPVDGTSRRLSAERAAELAETGWLCYPTFPPEKPASARDLARVARQGLAGDLVRFVAVGLVAAVLMQAPAVAVGVLTDWVLVSAAGDMLVQVMIALAGFAAVGVVLQILLGTSLMRIEGRAAARVSAAAWDRVLSLPPNFLRRFTTGDLASRMASFQWMRDQVSGVVANSLLAVAFLAPTLAIPFAYDLTLALVSLALGALSVAVGALVGLWQFGPQRRRFAAERRATSELLQSISGISKLRSAGAEPSAFARWAGHYRDQQLATIAVARLNEHLMSLGAATPALIGAALCGVAVWRGEDQLQVSDFLVVYAVAMTFYAAAANLARSFEAVAAAVPAYEQVRPVLRERPEPSGIGRVGFEIGGEVSFDHVSFRHDPDTEIITDVSISARPGEFIAIVGDSGAGKSTLMRLGLGLEDPTSGSVYYDGRDIAFLDRHVLRRQLGVVTQDAALQPGSLLDNIIGMGDDLTVDDAWHAARRADVADEIAEMPMQMHTVVTEGSTFSGGQAQRVRIAAALARNPRVVWLDEATSWLDSRSQAQVMAGIERLAATRIVIAHRLSTIRQADRIYVMQAGRVVQVGSFDELYGADGVFRQLVERQLA